MSVTLDLYKEISSELQLMQYQSYIFKTIFKVNI